MALELVTIPCLQDNYAYLLHDPATRQTAVVDSTDSFVFYDEELS